MLKFFAGNIKYNYLFSTKLGFKLVAAISVILLLMVGLVLMVTDLYLFAAG